MSSSDPSQFFTRDERSGDHPEDDPTDTSFATRDGDRDSLMSDDWWFSEGDSIAGRFLVRKQLGRGGMGEVYAVRDQSAREDRALKVMRAGIADSAAARERFRNESRVRRLRHECIVDTIDIGEVPDQNLLYISMELVDGLSLRHVMRSQQLSWQASLQICYLLCKALEYAHQNGVIHRDIKPDNVLVHVDGDYVKVWLTDFGIAQLHTEGLTRTGSIFGTLMYASPEQKRSASDVSAKSDLYGVGVLLYELLAGELPEGYFERVSTLVPGLPAGIDDLIQDALASRPENRIADAGLFAARLATLLKQRGASPAKLHRSPSQVESLTLDEIVFTDLQPKSAPQVSVEGVPGLPDEILRLEGQVASMKQTLAMINAATHPRLVEQQQKLDQLQKRVSELQHSVDSHRPSQLSERDLQELRELIRQGNATPSRLQQRFDSVDMTVLFPFVERLVAFVGTADRLTIEQERFSANVKKEKLRLVEELKSKQSRLSGVRQKDLRGLIATFFQEYRRQNAEATTFPLSAWGRFYSEILSQRRYDLSDVAVSQIAEEVWNPPQKTANRRGVTENPNVGELPWPWNSRVWSVVIIAVLVVFLSGMLGIALIGAGH